MAPEALPPARTLWLECPLAGCLGLRLAARKKDTQTMEALRFAGFGVKQSSLARRAQAPFCAPLKKYVA